MGLEMQRADDDISWNEIDRGRRSCIRRFPGAKVMGHSVNQPVGKHKDRHVEGINEKLPVYIGHVGKKNSGMIISC